MLNITSTAVSTIWAISTDVLLGLVLLVVAWRSVTRTLSHRGIRQSFVACLTIILTSAVGYQLYAFLYYHRSPIGRNLLPPHSLFFYKQLGGAIGNVLSGLVAAAVLVMVGLWLVRRNRLTQFGADDWLGLGLGTLAVGWPAVLPFLGLTFVLSIVGLLVQILLRKKTLNDRLIITPYIMPAAIVLLVLKSPILVYTHLDKIRF